jgi:glyoxylase-like metal-dependent hydrolase (beta-lactamase superfamily II)/rhodanese-related sulfurtransferase
MGTVTPAAFVDEGLGNSSYLVDLGDGRAAVVDPQRDVTPYLAAADRSGLRIAFSVETHLHADFLTGSRELAAREARVLAPRAAGLEWPHRGFGHGDEVDLGGLRLRALATPGHTPEHLSWLLLDGDRPVALFSGGALLAGSVARTDLIAPEQTEPLARALWRSLQATVLTLPDELPVHPTHGGGSFCTATTSGARTTTIGRERATNPLLAAPDEDAFVAALLGGYGSYPPYFLRLRDRNRLGPPVLGSPFPPLPPLAPAEVRTALDRGAVLVDARPVRSWAAGHVAGSLAIPLRPQFGTWLGWLVRDDEPLAFVLDDSQDQADLVRQARTIGYDHLLGVLGGGPRAWRGAGLAVATTEVVEAADVDGPVLDVRQAAEHATAHVPGALHVELGALPGASPSLPAGPLAVMCGHGERAATAASVLEAAGRHDVAVVLGGPPEWAAGGRRLATGP